MLRDLVAPVLHALRLEISNLYGYLRVQELTNTITQTAFACWSHSPQVGSFARFSSPQHSSIFFFRCNYFWNLYSYCSYNFLFVCRLDILLLVVLSLQGLSLCLALVLNRLFASFSRLFLILVATWLRILPWHLQMIRF